MIKKTLLLGIAMLIFASAFAQQRSGMAAGGAKNGKIKGRVIDSITKKPMEYANVAIYSLKEQKLIDGGITNAKGEFEIANLAYGAYRLVANFIGYEEKEVKPIKIIPQSFIVRLDDIILQPSTQNIEGVDVVAEKARVEYKIDKK